MKQRLLISIAAALVVASVAVTPARADNTTPATALEAVAGEPRSEFIAAAEATTNGGPDTMWFGYQLYARRSYRIYCWQPFVEGGGNCDAHIANATPAIVSTIQISEPASERAFSASSSSYYLPTVTDTYYGFAENDLVVGATTNLVLLETTLFAPWYFVDASNGYDGFIEIRNNTTSTQSATVHVYTSAGALAGSSTVSIPANGTALVQASSLNPSGFGSVAIAHTAMPGGISANITTLSAITGLSFDAPFGPRAQWERF
jgi:hypothetical protein